MNSQYCKGSFPLGLRLASKEFIGNGGTRLSLGPSTVMLRMRGGYGNNRHCLHHRAAFTIGSHDVPERDVAF